MNLNLFLGYCLLSTAFGILGCSSAVKTNGEIALRDPSSASAPSQDPLAELLRKGVLEANSSYDRKNLLASQETLTEREMKLRKALSLEGLSEDTKQLMVRDINVVSEQLREVSRSFPRESISRQQLGLKHINEIIEEFKKECPKNPITIQDNVISFTTKAGAAQARVALNDTYMPPYINFMNEDIGVRFRFEVQPKNRNQKVDRGGDGAVMFDKKTGRLKWARLDVFAFESPLPGRALESSLPDAALKLVEYSYFCKAQ